MNYCTASIGDGHEGTVHDGDLWWCQTHQNRRLALAEPPKNLDKTIKKIRRMSHARRVRFVSKLPERDRVWVSKRLAGG